MLTIPAGLGSNQILMACSSWLKSWGPKLVVWESCWGHGTAQTPNNHSFTYLQDSYYNWSQPVLTIPASLGSYQTLMACSHGLKLKKWNPMLLEYEGLVGGMAQLRHPSITLAHPYKTHTSSESVLTIPVDYEVISDQVGLFSLAKNRRVEIKFCLCASLSHINTRRILHLNQYWL